MALPEVGGAVYPTPDDIRDQILRTVRLAYLRRGIVANVKPGSDHYITATAFANVVTIAFSNNQIALNDVSPLTSTGDNLRKLARVFGVLERPATGASGLVVVKVTGSTVIPIAYQATAPNGKKYQTTMAQIVANGATVQLVGVDAGADTNQASGAILSWDSAAVGALGATCTVDASGLDGGSDADTDETLRARLIDRLAFPGAGGNWAAVMQWAQDANASIRRAFVYPAVRGPGSYDIAIIGSAADPVLGPSVINAAANAVTAQMPGFVSLNVTSVALAPLDVIVDLRLPLPPPAGGAGGGWLDAEPWPAAPDVVIVDSSYPGGNTLTITSPLAGPLAHSPQRGNRIAVWSVAEQAMAEFTIVSAPSPLGGAVWSFDIAPTNNAATSSIVVGSSVSAASVNMASYAEAVVASFGDLGPSEKTASQALLPRSLRKPSPDILAPTDATGILLSGLTAEHPEILDAAWGARFAAGTTTAKTAPQLPLTTAGAPYVLTLSQLAFRKA